MGANELTIRVVPQTPQAVWILVEGEVDISNVPALRGALVAIAATYPRMSLVREHVLAGRGFASIEDMHAAFLLGLPGGPAHVTRLVPGTIRQGVGYRSHSAYRHDR